MEIRKDKRDSLAGEIESELQKDTNAIDPGFIECRIDELYALDGLTPPELDEGQLAAAARTVRARAEWRYRNSPAKRRPRYLLKRRFTCWAAAACFTLVFFFSITYVSALVSGSCLPSKVGIKICCGTKYCPCGTARGE